MAAVTTDILERIRSLKTERNAVILAHNYQVGEIQDAADFVGDSLELSRKAAEVDADVIVFCGVYFMAETAAVLSPGKTVLLPVREAGCPMADMITAADVVELRRQHPGAAVVCYVNSSAAVKAECDCCCTSANAVEIVASFADAPEVVFVPDRHLGDWVAGRLGRELVLWPGYCPTHVRVHEDEILAFRRAFPDGLVMAHPECPRPIREAADAVLSTGGMCRYAREQAASAFLVVTETGMLHRLRQENPGKHFAAVSDRCVCPNMKKTRLEHVLWALEGNRHRIEVPEPVAGRARQAIERMLRVAAGPGQA
jgi:quinolinate synthase